ncbi:MAG: hypothetical protein ABJA79_02450 [Parafilimonas sp.]
MKIHPQFITLFFSLFIISIISGCTQPNEYPVPAEYDLNHPVKIEMPIDLDEISGIIYYPKDTAIFAEGDEAGILYKIFPNRHTEFQKWKFGKNADYEDLQLVDSTFYILSSKGNLAAIKFYSPDSLNVVGFEFPEKGNEFESLYFDKAQNKLIMLCKNCKDDKKSAVSSWAFNLSTQLFERGALIIDPKDLGKKENGKKFKFKPSATAINPLTNELFIISSVNKMLVIATATGEVKKVYPLNPALYKQPEGMAFTSSGDLLISNESAKEGPANILVFKLKRKN